MNFTNDEINMMCIYNGGSRDKTINELAAMRKHLEPEETELRELTDSVIQKLNQLSDADFERLDLFPDFDL